MNFIIINKTNGIPTLSHSSFRSPIKINFIPNDYIWFYCVLSLFASKLIFLHVCQNKLNLIDLIYKTGNLWISAQSDQKSHCVVLHHHHCGSSSPLLLLVTSSLHQVYTHWMLTVRSQSCHTQGKKLVLVNYINFLTRKVNWFTSLYYE